FQESRSSRDNPKRDWYVWSDTDQRYQGVRIIFLDTEDSNWAYDDATEQFYWHRFYSSQPDLNYDNPAVQQAMIDVARFWLEKGIDGFRVDAVPYLYEREGTISENLPETHDYLKTFRAAIEEDFPDALLLCEANQPPIEVVEYFGGGKEFQMAFNFPVMPRIYMALKSGDSTKLKQIIEDTPQIPAGSQWCTFLRNHDELTLEMVTEAERQWMWEQYSPDPAQRINLGIRRRLAPLLDNHKEKILLATRMLFSLPGAPIIYYGDEIGMGDNVQLKDRDGVRTPMQWQDGHNAGFSDAPSEQLFAPVIADEVYGYQAVNVASQEDDAGSLLNRMRQLVQIRKTHPVFALGTLTMLEPDNPAVLAFLRSDADETILVIHNLTDRIQSYWLDLADYAPQQVTNLFAADEPYPAIGKDAYKGRLDPYQSLWLLFY
ncbi:MAG: trehalose synthase, partial [Chloroflexi bacterium]|nr:trehalose synthase [Chloroflexota bacterium]